MTIIRFSWLHDYCACECAYCSCDCPCNIEMFWHFLCCIINLENQKPRVRRTARHVLLSMQHPPLSIVFPLGAMPSCISNNAHGNLHCKCSTEMCFTASQRPLGFVCTAIIVLLKILLSDCSSYRKQKGLHGLNLWDKRLTEDIFHEVFVHALMDLYLQPWVTWKVKLFSTASYFHWLFPDTVVGVKGWGGRERLGGGERKPLGNANETAFRTWKSKWM